MLKLQKMRIKKRLTASFMIVSAITAVAAAVACIVLIVISSMFSSALTNYGFAQGNIGRAMTAFSEIRSTTRAIIAYTQQDIVDQQKLNHSEHKASLELYMSKVKEDLHTAQEEALYNEITARLADYWAKEEKVLELGQSTNYSKSKSAQTMANDELGPIFNDVYASMTELMEFKVEKGNSLRTTLNILERVFIALIIFAIISAFFISTRLGRSIAKEVADPLEALSLRLQSFAKGDLQSPFPNVKTKDEVADMVSEAGMMADNLRAVIDDAGELMNAMAEGNYAIHSKASEKYVGDFGILISSMRKMNHQMNDTLHQIDDAADQVTAGSGNLAKAAQSMAQGATDQASAVQQLQTTIADLTAGVRKTATQVEISYKQAHEYAEKADGSKEEMQAMVSAMDQINETSHQIESIISEIEDIASQTNLLSLNAAIEAARAGEAGRGFAVVAEQIRKLAEQSAQSAIDTRDLIEGSLQDIAKGNHAAAHAAASIDEVVKGVRLIAETSRELSKISSDQAGAMRQAEFGVAQISEVVQANSATAEQTSATSEELAAQAASMNELVRKFRLK